jgi:predicted nucleic acid-binding protein
VIVLDTDVLSALMRPTANLNVIQWLDAQPKLSVWTTSVTIFELGAEISIMPEGRRRALVQANFDRVIEQLIEERIHPFDTPAAVESAKLAGIRRRTGRPGELRDTMIAGIAIARRATLATRNIRHFDDLSVPVVNPWTD